MSSQSAKAAKATLKKGALGISTKLGNLKDSQFDQKVAQFQLQSVARKLLPNTRLRHCLRQVFDRYSSQDTDLIRGYVERTQVTKSWDTTGVADIYTQPGVFHMNTHLFKEKFESVTHRIPTGPVPKALQIKKDHFGKVRFYQNIKTQKVFFNGLAVCGSVWTCPVCAAKITERRRVDMTSLLQAATDAGMKVSLLTLTAPHQHFDKLEDLLEKFGKARELLRGRKIWKRFVKIYDIVGSVRCLEVTHGANGWHVHTHELLFQRSTLPVPTGLTQLLDPDTSDSRRKTKRPPTLAHAWQDACLSVDLKAPSLTAGVDLSDGTYAAAYVSKWGLAHEVTKSHVKQGRQGGKTPFDLLRSVFEGGSSAASDGARFQEFATAFRGKQQIHTSQGLRALLKVSVEEKTDEELAEESELSPDDFFLGSLSAENWHDVVRYGDIYPGSAVPQELRRIGEHFGWPGILTAVSWIHAEVQRLSPKASKQSV